MHDDVWEPLSRAVDVSAVEHLRELLARQVAAALERSGDDPLATKERRDLARVHVTPCGFPVETEVTIDRKGQFEKKKAFYIRLNNGTGGGGQRRAREIC